MTSVADAGHASTDLSCHLLCAVPQLMDPNFHRSVVFMLEHGGSGALGLVVNNPMPTALRDVADSLDLEWQGDPDERVRLGGPVEPVRGWILHDQDEWDPAAATVAPGLLLTTSLELLMQEGHGAFGANGSRFLCLLGYAGWGPGQLEGEIAAGSWVVVPVRTTDDGAGNGVDVRWLFEAQPEAMWEAALRSIGVDPHRLVGLQGGGRALH
jgi:putative transcriptional regulator